MRVGKGLCVTRQKLARERTKRARGGGGLMKRAGMLVVSLRGVNFGFWSHLGCSGQNTIILSREGLV